jgi:hypothetical protein
VSCMRATLAQWVLRRWFQREFSLRVSSLIAANGRASGAGVER